MKVFLSSTAQDLDAYRKVADDTLLRLSQQVVAMERFGSLPGTPVEECERLARQSDVVICIVGHRYGFVPEKGGGSVTRREVEAAYLAGKDVLVWIVADDFPWPETKEQDLLADRNVLNAPDRVEEVRDGVSGLIDFKAWLRAKFTPDTFTTPDDLGKRIAVALANYVSGHTTPVVPQERISIARLPTSGQELIGRERELQLLDKAWENQNTNIIAFVARGGVGKTALVNHWLKQRMARDNYRGAERVYGWSFYSQTASERAASADLFVDHALRWFGDTDPTAGSPWDKGERLARYIRQTRTLLILDGLEPLQHPPGPQEGRLRDAALQALLVELAAQQPGLCVISTREPVGDLVEFEDSTVVLHELEDFSPKAPEFLLSESARSVFEKAQTLAMSNRKAGITSSCLLFALAESAGSEMNTLRFVRDFLDHTGRYTEALDAFNGGGGNPERQGAIDGGQLGRLSRNVLAVLQRAVEIAREVSDSDKIHSRHLFTALMVTPEGDRPLIARDRLRRLGVELSAVCRDFLEFLRSTRIQDDLAEWERILIPSTTSTAKPKLAFSPFPDGPAGYTAEFCGVGGSRPVVDYLGVKGLAYRLAELIALRETKLPLAIGLFGHWGSGKSHFMNLMDRRLNVLTGEEEKRDKGIPAKWCREIVPIYFNAWHYLDANLWASLVAQIFESLFAHLKPKEDALAQVQSLLKEASGATARAAEEVTIAENVTERAKAELSAAEENLRLRETAIDGLLNSLRRLLPNVGSDELEEHVIQLLNVRKEVDTLKDLQEVVREARSLGGRLHTLWNSVWRQPDRAWRLAWLVTAVVIVPILAIVAAVYLPFVRDWLRGIGRALAGLIAGLPAFLLWIRSILAHGNHRLNQVEDWVKQAEVAQQRARETPEVATAKMNFTVATAREEAAKNQLAEAEAREKQLKEEVKYLAPERRLGRYIEQRAQSSDYRGQLGLVSLARRDFQELSNLFADAEALEQRVADLRESQDQDMRADADKLEKLSRSIDRIVLFVDDLDRCQSEKVVEILQAVHLLLAFPLFAVVVGVDQRCLRQSLRMQFSGLLTSVRQENGKVSRHNTNTGDDERQATPLDYLEKIFHVPFHVPVMEKEGFGELIHRLSEPPKSSSSPEAEDGDGAQLPSLSRKAIENDPAGALRQASEGSLHAVPSAMPRGGPPSIARSSEQDQSVTDRVIGSVPLQDWEREALRDYYPLIQTPRGATRLLNTYRLVRAGIPKEEWSAFSVGGESRVAMLLLAAAAGYPAVAREWFIELQNDDPQTLFSGKTVRGSDAAAWRQLKQVYEATFAKPARQPTKAVMTKWIDRVETFTF